MFRRVFSILAIIVVIALVAWAAFKPQPKPAANRSGDRAQPVATVLSRAEDVPQRVEAQGTVVALNQVDVRTQVASTIREVHIREGQDVKAGQRLVTLDGRADAARVEQAAAQVAQLEAQLADAQRNLQRSKSLRSQGFIAQSAVDSAQASVDALSANAAASRANLAASRVALGYQVLSASLSGRVGAIDVHAGSLVQPNAAQPLFTITQLDPIGVRFVLPQSELQRVLQAQADGKVQAQVTLDTGKTLTGIVTFVDSVVDSASGTLALKAEFANPKRLLWPGLFTRVAVDLGINRNAVTVPTGALQTGPNGQFVYLVQADQTVQAQPVKLLRVISRDGKQFAVLDGVAGGVKLVAEGGQNLRPGSKVVEAKAGDGKSAKPNAASANNPAKQRH